MLCHECGLEMRIVGAATRPEQGLDGVLRIWRVSRVRCVNDACGREGEGEELRALLWEGVPPVVTEEEPAPAAQEEAPAGEGGEEECEKTEAGLPAAAGNARTADERTEPERGM